MVDYSKKLDEEIRAYMARSAQFYPPNAVDLTVKEQRSVYNAMCADFHQGHPAGVRSEDRSFGGVGCRCYETTTPSEVTVVYYHGGGFVVGGLDSHDDVCAEIASRTGFRVVSVDYALAPEAVFPRCFEDAWAAFEAISALYGSVVLAGDSAGGNLAAAVSHYARGRRSGIKGQLLIYPGLGGDQTRGSYVTHAEAPELTVRDMEFYGKMRTGGEELPMLDARFAPLRDIDFSNLPLSIVITAECDPLSSDGDVYTQRVLSAGGQAMWVEEAGLVHGYLRARSMSSKAAASFDRIVQSLSALGVGSWPSFDGGGEVG